MDRETACSCTKKERKKERKKFSVNATLELTGMLTGKRRDQLKMCTMRGMKVKVEKRDSEGGKFVRRQ